MLKILAGKNILFISSRFFNYEQEIHRKLESVGANVDYFDERPANDFITKSLIRVNKKLLKRKVNNYYKKIIQETQNNNYDIVLIIKGESISNEHLQALKILHPKAKFILYMWDNFSYTPNSKKIKHMFDHAYTFDRDDAATYKDMKFRPLFFIDDYKNIPDNEIKDIDVLFIGTVHTDRYLILKKIEKQLEEQNLNYFFYKYYPNKILFYLKKFFNPSFRKMKKEEFHFKGIPKQDILNYYSRAKVIIDIERPKQNGLTMRTIEVFGAKKKLITTNKSIAQYNLYDKNNIQIIDRDKPIVNADFIQGDYKDAKSHTYNKYSIEYWLYEILCEHPLQKQNKGYG